MYTDNLSLCRVISKSFILLQEYSKLAKKLGSFSGLNIFKMAAKRLPYSRLCDVTESKSKL